MSPEHKEQQEDWERITGGRKDKRTSSSRALQAVVKTLAFMGSLWRILGRGVI